MNPTAGLDEAIIVALRRITRAIDLHSRDLLQKFGLTAPQLVTLQEVVRLQPIPIGTLSQAVHLSQATMTGILDRLEQQGLVQRTRDGIDRRTVTITATREGTQLLKKAPSLLQDQFLERLARLKPAEQTQMLVVLQQISQMMGAADLTAAPILVSGADSLGRPGIGSKRKRAAGGIPSSGRSSKRTPAKTA